MDKKKITHSLTTYLPRAFNQELVRAIRVEAVLQHGISGLGKTSKYVVGLIMEDLKKKGYFDEGLLITPNTPVIEKAEEAIFKKWGIKLFW